MGGFQHNSHDGYVYICVHKYKHSFFDSRQVNRPCRLIRSIKTIANASEQIRRESI